MSQKKNDTPRPGQGEGLFDEEAGICLRCDAIAKADRIIFAKDQHESNPMTSRFCCQTAIIDMYHESMIDFVGISRSAKPRKTPIAKAVKPVLCGEDGIWYDPSIPFLFCPEHNRASNVLKKQQGICKICKCLFALRALGRGV